MKFEAQSETNKEKPPRNPIPKKARKQFMVKTRPEKNFRNVK